MTKSKKWLSLIPHPIMKIYKSIFRIIIRKSGGTCTSLCYVEKIEMSVDKVDDEKDNPRV